MFEENVKREHIRGHSVTVNQVIMATIKLPKLLRVPLKILGFEAFLLAAHISIKYILEYCTTRTIREIHSYTLAL